MLYSNSELLQAASGNEDKAKAVYEWAQGNPSLVRLNAIELVKAYDREHGEPQKEINVKEIKVETKSTYGAVDLGEDKTSHPSNEAPQPLFTTYDKVQLPEPSKDLMGSANHDAEAALDEMEIEYDHLYRIGDDYYTEEVDGSIEVLFAPVNDINFKNHYVTSDGMLVRYNKKRDEFKPAGVQKSKLTHNTFINKWIPSTKKRVYYSVGSLVYKTFLDRDYTERLILVIEDKDKFGRSAIHLYNLKALYEKEEE